MNRRIVLLAAAAGFALTSSPLAARPQANDTIRPKQGRDIRCRILKTTRDGIEYSVNGQNQQIDSTQVNSLEFAGEPNELSRARARYEGGQYADCTIELQKIDASALNDLMRSEYEALRAAAEAQKALVDGAVTLRDAALLVSQFLQNYPQSHHFYPLTEFFGLLAFHSGELAAAEQAFQTLADAPLPAVQVGGQLWRARLALLQDDVDRAEQSLQAVLQSELNDDAAQEAKLIARCLLAQVLARREQGSEGVAAIREIIQRENSQRKRVFASCYNSLGLCYLRAGDLKNAEMAFLHTDVLYASERELHAEALYYLSEVWRQLNRTERAAEARQVLTQQHRNSYWATRQ